MRKYKSNDYFFISLIIGIIIILFLLLSLNSYYKQAFALSPSFGLQELTNVNRHWIQTYGNSDEYLKSNYTDMLSVNYISDGELLNATIWLASGFDSFSVPPAVFSQPFRKLTYGMLVDADSNTETGYNGADYEVYVEIASGKQIGYIYQLSTTGIYKILRSVNLTKSFDPNDLQGAISLELPLKYMGYPAEYGLLFYTAESYKSNEVRQFTSWINIPPPSLAITTSPSNIMIRQGQEQTIPARIKSTTGFSNDVIKVTLADNNNRSNNYDMVPGNNSSDLHVDIERAQPPLFKITVPNRTPLGIYSIPLIVTIREPSEATLTKPISVNTSHGAVDPEFELSKKYPTVGYLTKPVNLTVTVIAPMSIGEHFKEFWGTYGQFIGLFAGGFIGAYAKVLFDKRKEKRDKEKMNE